MLTMQQLYERLDEIPRGERETGKVRVVFHGWENPSFNLPALGVHDPSFNTSFDMLITCEEQRDEH